MESNGIQGHHGTPQTNQLLAVASPMDALLWPYPSRHRRRAAARRHHFTVMFCGCSACPVLEALNPISALAPASIAVFQSMGATT